MTHPGLLEGKAGAVPITFHSALLKRVARSSLAAEIGQAAEADQADFLRAVRAEALYVGFDIDQWLLACCSLEVGHCPRQSHRV